MTHEGKAREIISWIEQNMAWKYEREVIAYVVEQLASAEKKGREERYILKAEIDQAWNEAISAAVKVASGTESMEGDSIASKIEALRKG